MVKKGKKSGAKDRAEKDLLSKPIPPSPGAGTIYSDAAGPEQLRDLLDSAKIAQEMGVLEGRRIGYADCVDCEIVYINFMKNFGDWEPGELGTRYFYKDKSSVDDKPQTDVPHLDHHAGYTHWVA